MLTYSQAKECIKELDRKGLEELIEQYDEDVVEAALSLGISPSTIAEAYQGKYRSDEDFAQSLAEDLGEIKNNVSWPYTCIDWEKAARELMYDYCEESGHYFRNL